MTLSAQIEAILFVEAKPVSLQKLAKLVEQDLAMVEPAVQALQHQYDNDEHGLRVLLTDSKVQLVTAPAAHELVTKLVQDERTGDLSKPSLETLAIIAYRSPVTKAEIEMIRGINCSVIIRNLLIRGLIEESMDKVKAVEVYDITPQYLQLLGVGSTQQLPNYEQLHRDIKIGEVLGEMQTPDDFFQTNNATSDHSA